MSCFLRARGAVGDGGRGPERRAGWSLMEVVVGMSLIATILFGVMASLSTSFEGNRTTHARIESQLLLGRVLEEIQASPYTSLLSFNGTFVEQGEHRASIAVALIEPRLTRIQVQVDSPQHPDISSSGVVLVADTE